MRLPCMWVGGPALACALFAVQLGSVNVGVSVLVRMDKFCKRIAELGRRVCGFVGHWQSSLEQRVNMEPAKDNGR